LTAATYPERLDDATVLQTARRRALRAFGRNFTMLLGGALLFVLVVLALAAPLLAPFDPIELNVVERLLPPSSEHWFGTDAFGRDIYSRTLYGGRISLLVGLGVAAFSTVIGLAIGLLSGYVRLIDGIVMRVMDGLMSIPGILLAIAMMALTRASVEIVIIAITVPEIPRVVRLVRSLVLSIREQTYIQAAIAVGSRLPKLLLRHILPNAAAPVIVQATYICASAVLIEAYLSFLGVGTPPEIPSWGNIIAEGRQYVQLAFWNVSFPGLFLGAMVLAINLLGDGLRDMLDPRMARRM
jgi:peptide/nickel transport system permease protein